MMNLTIKLIRLLCMSAFCHADVEEGAPAQDFIEVKLTNGCRLTKEKESFYLYIEPGCGRFGVVPLPKSSNQEWAVYKIVSVLGGWVDLDGDGKLERKSTVGKVIRIKTVQQGGAAQPASAVESKAKSKEKPKVESEGRSQ